MGNKFYVQGLIDRDEFDSYHEDQQEEEHYDEEEIK